jgi:hypothetical protein
MEVGGLDEEEVGGGERGATVLTYEEGGVGEEE